MKTLIKTLSAASFCLIIANSAQAKDETWNSPSGEYARKAIISGDVEKWPNFSPGPAMRVQQQHPKTALTGQAKYVEGNGTTGAICQYYNHIGFAITMVAVGVTQLESNDKSYWRKEYTESTPEQDDPDNLMMEVCMIDKNGLAYMSVGCKFLLPK